MGAAAGEEACEQLRILQNLSPHLGVRSGALQRGITLKSRSTKQGMG